MKELSTAQEFSNELKFRAESLGVKSFQQTTNAVKFACDSWLSNGYQYVISYTPNNLVTPVRYYKYSLGDYETIESTVTQVSFANKLQFLMFIDSLIRLSLDSSTGAVEDERILAYVINNLINESRIWELRFDTEIPTDEDMENEDELL